MGWPGAFISQDTEIGRECRIVGRLHRGFEDGLECHTRLLRKHAKKCFAIFQATEVASVSYEEARCLPKSLEAVVGCLHGCCAREVRVRVRKETEGAQVFERRANDRVRR